MKVLTLFPQGELETIERATLDAVPPQRRMEIGSWLVAMDDGTVGRAHSAAALHEEIGDVADMGQVVDAYRAASLRPMFRLSDLPGLRAPRDWLQAQGYASSSPTLVQTAEMDAVLQATQALQTSLVAAATIEDEADDAWCQVFLGEGFDPADGQSRVGILRRARHSVFASVRVDGHTVASGMLSMSQGWASVHGMRTLASWRGKGFAGAILHAMARHAASRGFSRMFLQVEQGNLGAQALYRRLGFVDRWRYDYWSPAA